MVDMRFRRVRSRFWNVTVAAVVAAALVFVLLPYDHPLWLAFRFNATRLGIYLHSSYAGSSWLYRLPEFPIDITQDVGLIIKTGYGTRHRLPAVLKALETGFASRDVVVIADFTPGDENRYYYHGNQVQVHDVLAMILADESLKWMRSSPRLKIYLKMTAAITKGNHTVAEEVSKNAGWELDATKFAPGMKLAFDLMPRKKWYIILDDDTYLIRPSMRLLLQHLDPNIPQYIGNPVGDFKARFAHGGSSVLLSRPVLQKLFIQNPKVVSAAYSAGLTETWGDKLVATTLMKVGIYLDERYEQFFNGESPLAMRIWPDRFCLPLVAFHGLAQPQLMRQIGEVFADLDNPVLWSDIWKIYHAPDLNNMVDTPIRIHEDHVGRTDKWCTTIEKIDDANACLQACDRRSSCLAWTWDAGSKSCNISPWMVVGHESLGSSSGVNALRARKLLNSCHRS